MKQPEIIRESKVYFDFKDEDVSNRIYHNCDIIDAGILTVSNYTSFLNCRFLSKRDDLKTWVYESGNPLEERLREYKKYKPVFRILTEAEGVLQIYGSYFEVPKPEPNDN